MPISDLFRITVLSAAGLLSFGHSAAGEDLVITDQIFPGSQQPVLEIFAGDKSASVTDVRLHPLRSVWRKSR